MYSPIINSLQDPLNRDLSGTDLVSGISKIIRIDGAIYAVGGPLRVYKRIEKDTWVDFSKNINVPNDFIAEENFTYTFYDMAGFSNSDMYVVGESGNVWHFNGNQWQQMAFPENIELDTVACATDGNVYITDVTCAVWVGRNATWRKVSDKKMPLRFFDSAWFSNRLWLANDYGMWGLEGDQLIPADKAQHNPVPTEMYAVANRIDISPDKKRMLVCGPNGAAIYDGEKWELLFNKELLES